MAEKNEHTIPVEDREALPVWQQELVGLVERIADNPLPFLVGFAVIALSLAAGGLYQLYAMQQSAEQATAVTRAHFIEDEDERLEALEAIAEEGHAWSDEALYLAGEEHFERGEYDAAGRMYAQVAERYPDSPWAPRAAEGLAYIDEINQSFLEAISGYERVRDAWPDSFTARRQSFNIARASETHNDMQRAVDEYRNQIEEFPESNIAARAQAALDRLKDSHAELFPEEAAPEAVEAPEEESASADVEEEAAEPAAAEGREDDPMTSDETGLAPMGAESAAGDEQSDAAADAAEPVAAE